MNDEDLEALRRRARLLVCVGPRCDAEGRGRALHEAALDALSATFSAACADGRLRIETRDCLRLCTRDPVVRIEPSGEAFSGASLAEIISLVRAELAPAPDANVGKKP
jgi:NADH:ubiquinone oxidoreductase subunit E